MRMKEFGIVGLVAVVVLMQVTCTGTTSTRGDHESDGDTEESDGDTDGDSPGTDGDNPDGDGGLPDGDLPDGDLPDGDQPDGDQPDGDQPDGDQPDGDQPDGDQPDGDQPDGDQPDGDQPDGDDPDPPGLEWVAIPGGNFHMGCGLGDTNCDEDENPRHVRTMHAFRMSATPITQTQYEALTGESPSRFEDREDAPVEKVDWHQAKAFCEALNGRLPSEAEWEYAARAGTTTLHYCGDSSACLNEIACWNRHEGSLGTCPVGERTPNAFGLYDITGNTWEWVEDCYHGSYEGAPATGGVWESGDCTYRIVRGGAWNIVNPGYMRLSYRNRSLPDTKSSGTGFRCVKD